MSETHTVVWDGTAKYGRYLSVQPDPPREAPRLARQQAQTTRLVQVRAWFTTGRSGTMREVLADLVPACGDQDQVRRAVYLLAQRGHLRYTTRETRPGLIVRVYGEA